MLPLLSTHAGDPDRGAATFQPAFRVPVGRAEHHTARLGRSGVTGQGDPGCATDHDHAIQAAAPPAETAVRGSLASWIRSSLNYSGRVKTALFGHGSLRPLLLVAARKQSRSSVGTGPFSRGSVTIAAQYRLWDGFFNASPTRDASAAPACESSPRRANRQPPGWWPRACRWYRRLYATRRCWGRSRSR